MKNFVSLEGNLACTPELIELEENSFHIMRIAQNYEAKGEKRTDWFEVAVFEDHLKNMCKNLETGDRVLVSGHIKPIKKKVGDQSVVFLKISAASINKIAKLEKGKADGIPPFNSKEEVRI